MSKPIAVLFVCLGNICRSPLAEAAFRAAADKTGIRVNADSVGTAAYHVGSPPDPRSVETAARHGVDISGLRARQLSRSDFFDFDFILAMDHENLRNIKAAQPEGATAKVSLLMDMVPGREGAEIADPYYDGEEQFGFTWADVSEAAEALATQLTASQ